MSVIIVPAPPKPTPVLPPVVWDVSINYDEVEKKFYARSDIDHRIYISNPQHVYLDPENGEMKAE